MNENYSRIDFSLTGFEPNGLYVFSVHDNGDVSNQCANIGNVFNPGNEEPPQGYLGSFNSND